MRGGGRLVAVSLRAFPASEDSRENPVGTFRAISTPNLRFDGIDWVPGGPEGESSTRKADDLESR